MFTGAHVDSKHRCLSVRACRGSWILCNDITRKRYSCSVGYSCSGAGEYQSGGELSAIPSVSCCHTTSNNGLRAFKTTIDISILSMPSMYVYFGRMLAFASRGEAEVTTAAIGCVKHTVGGEICIFGCMQGAPGVMNSVFE